MLKITSLVTALSRSLAPEKHQLEAALDQALALAEQEGGDPAYPRAVRSALLLLEESASVSEFLDALRKAEQA